MRAYDFRKVFSVSYVREDQIYERSGYRYLLLVLLKWLRKGYPGCNAGATRPRLKALGGTKTKKRTPERGKKGLHKAEFLSGGTRIRTVDTMIFSHVPRPLGMR